MSVVSCWETAGSCPRLAWLFVQVFTGLIVSELVAIFYIVVGKFMNMRPEEDWRPEAEVRGKCGERMPAFSDL